MEKPEQILNRSAELLASSRRVLFLTSAGMSADSNIPTFRDKNGYWKNFPPFKERNLEAQDLASPWAFRNVLAHAWAFYEWRRRNAHENEPHQGYHIINRWMTDRFDDAFIHTTNNDGYHLRSGSPANRMMETHGSMWRLQCLEVCSHNFWDELSVPLCEMSYDTMKAWDYPLCPHCKAIARPHILMFGDGEYVGHPEQERSFQRFLQQPIDLAILVGSSGAVPTNDYIALHLKDRGTKVININPDPAANAIVGAETFLTMTSKAAFIQLDKTAFG